MPPGPQEVGSVNCTARQWHRGSVPKTRDGRYAPEARVSDGWKYAVRGPRSKPWTREDRRRFAARGRPQIADVGFRPIYVRCTPKTCRNIS